MRLAKPLALTLFALTTAGVANATVPTGPVFIAQPDLLAWADCPPGLAYGFGGTQPAHFQDSPAAGPSGGACSLDVVSGNYYMPTAGSAGGVAFLTAGELAGRTYTIAFDFRFVSGTQPWQFADETGSGDVNGLTFELEYPGDDCWHHYEYTAPLGAAGPKSVLFVYQANAGPEEMKIDNMTLRVANPLMPLGLQSSAAGSCACTLAP